MQQGFGTRIGSGLGWAFLLLAVAAPVTAHDFTITDTLAVLKAGRFQVDMTVDLDALLLGVPPGHPPDELVARIESLDEREREDRMSRLEQLFLRRVRVFFDGETVPFVVSFPDRREHPAHPSGSGLPSVLGTTARLTGTVPEGARTFTFRASRAFRAVRLTVVAPEQLRSEQQLLAVGETSVPFDLLAAATGDEVAAEPRGVGPGRYLWLGFTHILPLGYDHVLFVLGLFLLGNRFRPLLLQVSAFTVAHTATLALSVYGVVKLPASVVEPIIALSIAYVGAEAQLVSRRGAGPETTPSLLRLGVIFTFGLLHGLGFAGVLAELGLPEGRLLGALLAFNVGVELGQIAVLALAFLVLGWARSRTWYRGRVVLPLSAALAVFGVALALERIFF